MSASGFVGRLWRWARWPLALFAAFVIGMLGWRMSVLDEKERTAEAVAAIHANRLEWSDINGDLPPAPDPELNDATLVGVDSNENGIRDDVERSIYGKYKSQPKLAVAMLQYAKELQMEFTHVFNSETLVAVMQEESRGFSCAYENEREVRDLVFNNKARQDYRETIRAKYMTSYSLPNEEDCDLSI